MFLILMGNKSFRFFPFLNDIQKKKVKNLISFYLHEFIELLHFFLQLQLATFFINNFILVFNNFILPYILRKCFFFFVLITNLSWFDKWKFHTFFQPNQSFEFFFFHLVKIFSLLFYRKKNCDVIFFFFILKFI